MKGLHVICRKLRKENLQAVTINYPVPWWFNIMEYSDKHMITITN